MSGREEAIKYIEESIRDLKQFCKIHQQDDWKKMNEKFEALVALYATLDLLKEQKENEHNEEKEEE